MTYFVKYRREDGAFMGCGSCMPADLAVQVINRPDLAVLESLGEVLTMTSGEEGVPTPVVNLAPVQGFLIARVDEEAEAQRLRFITPGAGMALTYLRKEQEALSFLNGGDAGPMLEAEAEATGHSLADIATTIAAAAAHWAVVGAAIEGARMAAKQAIGSTFNLKNMAEAAAIDWAAVTDVEA